MKLDNSIIEKLPQATPWAEVKAELCSVLGEGQPKKRALESLISYKPKSKGLGEMASDIMAKAVIATNDADLQTQLGLQAFLKAVTGNIGHELRRRHFSSVREALAEARFLQYMEEEEDRESGKVFTAKEEVKPVKEPKVDLNRVVEACMRQLQTLQACKKQSERPGYARKRRRCWCCGQKGHLVRACPLIHLFSEIKLPASARRLKRWCQRVPPDNGARGCQMVQESARWCQNGPEGAIWYQRVPGASVRGGVRGCQRVPDNAKGCQRVPDGTSECQRVPEDARWCQRVPDGVRWCKRVPDGTRECQSMPEWARWCQWVPDGVRGRQRVPEGPDRAGCGPRLRQKGRFDFCYGLHSRSRGGCHG